MPARRPYTHAVSEATINALVALEAHGVPVPSGGLGRAEFLERLALAISQLVLALPEPTEPRPGFGESRS